jgi:hypothetical protein
MVALDGNAIAGLLFEVFGTEMTTATVVCVTCRAEGRVAELVVYVRAPGTIVRCPRCASVLMVLVDIRGTTRVDLRGLARLDVPHDPARPTVQLVGRSGLRITGG